MLDLYKVSFGSADEAQSYFAQLGDHTNHRFPDLAQVGYWAA